MCFVDNMQNGANGLTLQITYVYITCLPCLQKKFVGQNSSSD